MQVETSNELLAESVIPKLLILRRLNGLRTAMIRNAREISSYAGVQNARRRFVGDELLFCHRTFSTSRSMSTALSC
jgi:hypothetical protein